MSHDSPGLDAFDHVIVLMMENRSFDNLLGHLYEHERPAHFIGRGERSFRGVSGRSDLFNLDDRTPPARYPVRKAPSATPEDMCHPCPDPGEEHSPHINRQLYGVDPVPEALLAEPAPMSGFVRDYIEAVSAQIAADGGEATPEVYGRIMNCFTPEAMPVINGLARQFACSDEWFCSVPSQTFCNRSFFHSGQSHGWVHNPPYLKWLENHSTTVFERLSERFAPGQDWRIYWDRQDVEPLTKLIHPHLARRRCRDHFHSFADFAADCARGDLPAYTFIQPRLIFNHNDMHPPGAMEREVHSSLLAGELLINEVYNAVRHGAKWLRTLLVVTFDEHGGCYDHWPPPTGAAPPLEDPPYELEKGFRFDRFGVRVPTIFVSPYIAPGTVVRAEGDIPFDHTSMIRTLCAKWGLEALTDRDRAAPDFAAVFNLSERDARVDTPELSPRPYTPITAAQADGSLLNNFQKAFGHLIAHHRGLPPPHEARTVGELLDAVKAGGD